MQKRRKMKSVKEAENRRKANLPTKILRRKIGCGDFEFYLKHVYDPNAVKVKQELIDEEYENVNRIPSNTEGNEKENSPDDYQLLDATNLKKLQLEPLVAEMAAKLEEKFGRGTVIVKQEKGKLPLYNDAPTNISRSLLNSDQLHGRMDIQEHSSTNFGQYSYPTSPIFATILVEYLLKRMEEMGSNIDRSNLYLKLFKLVFVSVSLFPAENEVMLRPYLLQIVNRSMELALSAKEPYNYFLLLRALFRSIGGGSHDLLYQEFLPLLPNLLQGLNSLQCGLHNQHMKDLFVELCLTVPVRLSSLLHHLPMLMDPLVSALNGSPTLVSQVLNSLQIIGS